MAQFREVSLTDRPAGAAPERLPLPTCILAIASMSLALWLLLGLALRLSL